MVFFSNSNQSARELSQFAESAMAVKRVIMQHFSMKYDYMNKERPNIYHPSRAGIRSDDSTTIDTSNIIINHIDGDDFHLINGKISCSKLDQQPSEIDCERNDLEPEITNDGFENENNLNNEINLQKSSTAAAEKRIDAIHTFKEQQLLYANNRRSASTMKQFSSSNGLDSIMEIKEKLSIDVDLESKTVSSPFKIPQPMKHFDRDATPNNKTVIRQQQQSHQQQDNYYSKKKPMVINTRNNVRPEENWRHRSNSNPMDFDQPIGFKNYRNYTNNNNSTYLNSSTAVNTININANINNNNTTSNNNCRKNQYYNEHQNYPAFGKMKVQQDTKTGIDLRNWRNECIYNSARNCGMAETNGVIRQNSSDLSDSDSMLSIGLSPPSESLLMQRRMRMTNRASEIVIRSPPPATASG